MVASPYLLHKIGLKFARSILDKNLNPEQKLWREVVINAFDETLILQSDRKSSLIKISAHNWIIGGDKDFKQVCEWGTLDPEDMKDCYEVALKKRQVSFSQRQLAWKEYDKLYRRMISEDNKIVRKIKRKQVDDFRKKVKSIPDILISTVVLSVFV